MKRKVLIPLAFVFLIFFLLWFRKTGDSPTRQVRFILGTLCEIELGADSDKVGTDVISKAFGEIKRFDEMFSVYKKQSNVSRLNLLGSGQRVEVTPETYELVGLSLQYAELSQGLFDITIYPLVKAWGFYELKDNVVPQKEVIQEAVNRVDWTKVHLEEDAGKKFISFQGMFMGMDLGGIGKGYICDQVASFLRRQGVENFLVNIGGNIYAAGLSPSEKPWTIGVRDPHQEQEFLMEITLQNQAVATSGDYERYFEYEGKRYGHILNPKTGWPIEDRVAVTVISDTATQADAGSTILFLADPTERDKMFHSLGLKKAWIVSRTGDGFDTVTLSI